MRNWIGLLTILVLPLTLLAQNRKFGYVNTAEIIQSMPEIIQAQQTLEQYAKQLDGQYQAMMEEYEKKLSELQQNQDVWPDAVKEIKVKELTDLQMRIQEFQLKAQENLQMKQAELMQPILEKIKNAIEQVAKERGVDYVFDVSSGALLVMPPGDDLTPYVKQKLGLQ
ncbi:MAG: OmpH family outer membrane protein [Chlorobi bacterium]|nr:OmpH family outer membrane protein [Chlorobiota bacterium]